ncbi:hypothetical protein OAB57_01320 [Bacteriovoracaceae bacterium]|nr:hypothetical protein [Bacteriovoracaceae bacterium]
MLKILLCLISFDFLKLMSEYSNQAAPEWDYRLESSIESRLFTRTPKFSSQQQTETAFRTEGSISYSWDDDRSVAIFSPYVYFNSPDHEKNHYDIREAIYIGAFGAWDLRVGIGQVFWGVTESQHLIDVVNQTDGVQNIDGEDKLGQPMINPSLVTDWGTFSVFFLPYFREQTFPHSKSRLRTDIVILQDETSYEHDKEQNHWDYAGRYSVTIDDFDLGLSFFNGTDRDPEFKVGLSGTQLVLRPHYIQTTQYGLDMQYIWDNWLFKFEGIVKDRHFSRPYIATAGGFEYTFSNIWGGRDIGVLAEHLYDERKDNGETFFYDHTFVGARLAYNDENSFEVLAGVTINNERGTISSFRWESNRRINSNWKWELEANIIVEGQKQQLIYQLKDDDYIQFSIQYFL